MKSEKVGFGDLVILAFPALTKNSKCDYEYRQNNKTRYIFQSPFSHLWAMFVRTSLPLLFFATEIFAKTRSIGRVPQFFSRQKDTRLTRIHSYHWLI